VFSIFTSADASFAGGFAAASLAHGYAASFFQTCTALPKPPPNPGWVTRQSRMGDACVQLSWFANEWFLQ
jgi:hypothetical protein